MKFFQGYKPNWLKQIFCKHVLISKDPIEAPEIWGWVQECGKCGHRKDVTRQVLFGKIKFSQPDEFDALIARKRRQSTE